MPQGRVKWFNEQKGYGFIEQENGEDLFVHFSDVQGGRLRDGVQVEFEVGQGKKGLAAKEVKIV
ncbi:MAG: cold-shock protein [bacterium]|jgi:CspA family cold shock protein